MHYYNIVMFGWCCQQQNEINQELFIYRANNQTSSRQVFNISQLNQTIVNEKQQYQIYEGSQYEAMVQRCKEKHELFVDQEFDINKEETRKRKGRRITWVRLRTFTSNGKDKLFQQKNMKDIVALSENDSYFTATLAALSNHTHIIRDILDGANEFNDIGIYKLNICVNGKPKQLLLDDLIPVFQDNHSRPVFSRAERGSLWILLFQKAYAKIRGGYDKIASGYAHEVLATFTIAPCLYNLIPLNFDQNPQDKLWLTITESVKNSFPLVCGSRKRYTCQGIAMNQTYPLEDCWIEQKKGTKKRMIKLVNIPGVYEQSKDCTIELCDNGATIQLELVEFMRNFEVIDVAHVRPAFNSHFYAYKSNPAQFKLYIVDIPANAQFYLTLQRQNQEKGNLRIMLAKVLNNCQTDYSLVLCKFQQIFTDVSLECFNLEKGRYVVCCQSSIKSDCFLRIYSPITLQFQQINEQPIKFLQHICYDNAIKHKQNFSYISKNSQDWYYSKLMFEEIGFSFFIVHLHNLSKNKCYINYRKDELEKQGYNVINKNVRNFKVELKASNIEIILFQTVSSSIKKQFLQFPPRSLEIKIVI